jgi:hypothetical protein
MPILNTPLKNNARAFPIGNCLAIDKTGAEKNHEPEFEPPRPPRGLWEALSDKCKHL